MPLTPLNFEFGRALENLQIDEDGEGQSRADCPCHGGHSLVIKIERHPAPKLVFQCWAGCEKPEILSALNLTFSSCYLDAPSAPDDAVGARRRRKSSKSKQPVDPLSQIEILPVSDEDSALFSQYAASKPGVTVEALQAVSARICLWPKNHKSSAKRIVIPAKDGSFRKVRGLWLANPDASMFPPAGTLPERKTHTVGGSLEGWIVCGRAPCSTESSSESSPPGSPLAFALAAQHCHTVIAVEGPPDLLAAYAHLPNGWAVATNLCGSSARGSLSTAWLKGKTLYAIGDDDSAGQLGITKVINAAIPHADAVHKISLPFPPGSGKDLRDFLAANGDLLSLIHAPDSESPAAAPITEIQIPDNLKPNEADDDPHRLARSFLDSHHPNGTLRFYRDSFYRIDDGHENKNLLPRHTPHQPCYTEYTSNEELRSQITKHAKHELTRRHLEKLASPSLSSSQTPVVTRVTTHLISNILQALKGETSLPFHKSPPFWIDPAREASDPASRYLIMKNGILPFRDFIEGRDVELLPHTPELFSTIHMPYPFDINSTCPQWLKFLDKNLESDPERISLLQEWFGYNLIPDTSFQKFLVLEGEGSNGKSVICAALESLVGSENCSHVALELFGQRFQLTETLNKLSNISGDVGELDKAAEGFLKSFTSGDSMMFDRKMKSPINAEPTARLTMAMNNRPRFSDKSEGLWRRMILIPMNVQIRRSERVLGMDKPGYWLAQNETPGIFLWALAGLARLLRQKEFTASALSNQALDDYRSEMNPTRDWLKENFQESRGSTIEVDTVYDAYRKFCNKDGNHPMNKKNFGKEVHREFRSVTKRRVGARGQRYHIYENLDWESSEFGSDESLDLDFGESASGNGSNSGTEHPASNSKNRLFGEN